MSMTVGTDGSGPLGVLADRRRRDRLRERELAVHGRPRRRGVGAFLSGGLEMRMVDGVVVHEAPRGPRRAVRRRQGRRPVALDQGARGRDGAGGAGSAFGGVDQSDPASFLSALQRISDDVKEVGNGNRARRGDDALPRDARPPEEHRQRRAATRPARQGERAARERAGDPRRRVRRQRRPRAAHHDDDGPRRLHGRRLGCERRHRVGRTADDERDASTSTISVRR